MKDFFTDIFEYHHHYNQQLADLLSTESGKLDSDRCVSLFSHIINAHHIWNHRILQMKPTATVWQLHPVAACKEMDSANFADTSRILAEVDLSREMSFRTGSGIELKHKVRDFLFHTANHTTYHRGQIMSELRRNGIEPLVTDYIFYKRP